MTPNSDHIPTKLTPNSNHIPTKLTPNSNHISTNLTSIPDENPTKLRPIPEKIPNQATELLPLDVQDVHQRKTKRLGINKGQLVKLVFNQEQVHRPCEATVVDDSFHGCGLLVNSNEQIYKDQKILILIEDIEPIKAKVMWFQSIGNDQFRMGVKYVSSKALKTKLFFQKTHSPKH
ncbi:MAG: hypothetical protein AB4063_15065 [Crocosphaera sp.]